MARGVPPQQPHLGRDADDRDVSAPEPDARHEPEAGHPVRVRVSDASKVSRVDTGSLEEAPPLGGRFSTWRRRRAGRGATGEEGEAAGPAQPQTTVVPFPRGEAARRRRRWFAVLAVVLAALLFVGVVFFSPVFTTRTVTVEGARLTNPEGVEDALSRFKGVPLTRVSKNSVREAVGDLPQVRSVDVVLEPPHTIIVHLHERVGIAVVRDGERWVLVSSQGEQLATFGSRERPDVPVIDGGREVLTTDKFATVAEVLAELPAEVLARLDGASASSEASVELSFGDGRKAIWGDASDSELKARVLAALVSGEATASAGEYDVSAPLHPVVK